jgi:hypothetical protein
VRLDAKQRLHRVRDKFKVHAHRIAKASAGSDARHAISLLLPRASMNESGERSARRRWADEYRWPL